MPTKRYSTEQIVSKLRQAEVELSRWLRVPLVCRKLGIIEQTYYRWRKEYGGRRLDQAKRLKERERENTQLKKPGGRPSPRQRDPERGDLGKLLSPPRRREAVAYVRHQLGVSERRACRVLGPARVPADEPRLVERIIALATAYGRYGYRRITGLLRGEGWRVNHKRVERLWRREGLKVPQKQPKLGRLWLTDGSCVRCCQWQPKTAHFWQLKTAHFGERAVGRSGRSPVDAQRACWAGRRERSDRSPGQHAPRRCGAGGHDATPSRRCSDADCSQC